MKLSNTFPEPSGSDENPPVSKWTADESQSTEGLDSRATGGELFTIPETKSPRLCWLEKHGVTCYKSEYDHAGPTDPDELWRARIASNPVEGKGATMDDAIVDMAKRLNLKLWNEQ